MKRTFEHGTSPGAALLAGVLGGLAVSGALLVTRQAGWSADLELALGAMLVPEDGAVWLAGLAMHLGIAAALGVIYVAIMHRVLGASSALAGMVVGVVHAWLAGTVMLLAMFVSGRVLTMDIAPPYLDLVGVAVLWAGHVLFGAVVGGVYAVMVRPVSEARDN